MELRSSGLATSSFPCWAVLLTKPWVFANCLVLSNSINLSLSYKNILESTVNRSITDVHPPLLEVQLIGCRTSTNKAKMNASSRTPFCDSMLVFLESSQRDNIAMQSVLFSVCICRTNSEDSCTDSRCSHHSTHNSLFPSPLPLTLQPDAPVLACLIAMMKIPDQSNLWRMAFSGSWFEGRIHNGRKFTW